MKAADDQHQSAAAFIPQFGEAVGEGARGMGLAVLVASDDVGVFQMSQQDLGLGGFARLFRLDLDHLDRPEAERPAGGGGPLGIVLGQGRFRRPAQTADGEQRDDQLAATA